MRRWSPWDMERAELLGRLPHAHAVALRLRDAGADDAVIAVALAIEPESVPSLLAVAAAKADRILRSGDFFSEGGCAKKQR